VVSVIGLTEAVVEVLLDHMDDVGSHDLVGDFELVEARSRIEDDVDGSRCRKRMFPAAIDQVQSLRPQETYSLLVLTPSLTRVDDCGVVQERLLRLLRAGVRGNGTRPMFLVLLGTSIDCHKRSVVRGQTLPSVSLCFHLIVILQLHTPRQATLRLRRRFRRVRRWGVDHERKAFLCSWKL
jgi:hypothetical protein